MPSDKADNLRQSIARLKEKRNGIILGREKLAQIHKRVGDRFTVTGLNYKDIDLEFEVVGVFPDGRYDKSAVMNRDYLNAALDAYPRSHAGQKHPLADKSLNLVWLRVPDMQAFNTVQEQISQSPLYTSPAVKCETASSGIATFLEAYRDLIWGMRWLLAPAILLTLSLVIANAISISVRERRLEFAVLRVLGFRPLQVLALVVGEAVLLGAGSGLDLDGCDLHVDQQGDRRSQFPDRLFRRVLHSGSGDLVGAWDRPVDGPRRQRRPRVGRQLASA